jgi:integrase
MHLKLTEAAIEAIRAPIDKAQAYYFDTEASGFALVVGRTGAKTFVVRARIAGRQVKVTIGAPSPGPWNVVRARKRARELLVDMANGINPNVQRAGAEPAEGLTLREARDLHLAEMRDKNRREVSIRTLDYDVGRLLVAELDQPLANLTVEAVQLIKERGRKYRTQTNRLLAHLSAIWNTARRLRRSTFTAENPIGRHGIAKYALAGEHEPERPRIKDADLPEWFRRVGMLSSAIRRDLQMLTLFTGLRDANATTLRWEIIDWHRHGFVIPMSKTTPFTIPFGPTVRDILEARQRENPFVLAERGDAGFVFPTLDTNEEVVAIAETKERRHDKIAPPWLKHGPAPQPYKLTGKRVLFLPGLHTLRRTFLSVADDLGVPRHVQMLLSNHSFGGRDVHEHYLRAEWSRLVEWVEKIDHALWVRLGGRTQRRPTLPPRGREPLLLPVATTE